MLLLDSGILLSRSLVQKIVDTMDDHLWQVAFQIGLPADEILSEIVETLGIIVRDRQTDEFLGRGWRSEEHYKMFLNKSFDSLPICSIPFELLRPGASQLGLCSPRITQVNDMSVWSALNYQSKEDFLNTAEKMLENIPQNVCYYWDRLYPTICIKK
ncbi:hypothetical protein TVAGG3_0866320 [Trichomonas vaginalis G3]|nr:uncharacterized protein TVAGG3_1088820 [Trichomonas vaginalis G3]XP_051082894.1 hypothetical protein TVAGG3_0802650 [Trichomonas vaginalis G3]XP_051085340.1 hypothetical protein TVAGG3_0866320 [Trichomonas vaginalis G3]KAI5482299.1 hypothetical protein TVAGG3_1088820 [Trichomonas vaginalis G3]KAI5496617.1 hypothetical protein TVAGG3_0802650 [Trichomonas vaginalis G3]KAI5501052.1 hypothetical protein TVAGG3_0866320 [Trichomonas vaginalis G3]